LLAKIGKEKALSDALNAEVKTAIEEFKKRNPTEKPHSEKPQAQVEPAKT
jgi:hypothetical protein